jgi:hypothetical protein
MRPLRAAKAEGMLAILQPANDDAPAMLKFFSPDAQLNHELPLAADMPISAAALSADGL